MEYLSYNPVLAFGDDPPKKPAELALLEELEAWKAFPHMGGYLDQPLALMADLRTVRNARGHHMNARANVVNSDLQQQIAALQLTVPAM